MPNGEAYLDEIRAELQRGRRQWKRGDKLLEVFGYTRRRQTAIDQINAALAARGMTTEPVLTTSMPLDHAVRFRLIDEIPQQPQPEPEPSPTTEAVPTAAEDDASVDQAPTVNVEIEPPPVDPERSLERSLIVGNLACAENIPIWIAPTATVQEALTIMDLRDFSQLVVSTGARDPKGIISYKSIARAYLHSIPKTVKDCLDQSVPRVQRDEPLLGVVAHFAEHDAVLVLGPGRELLGIVTPSDIAHEFGGLAGPFLLIGQIEEQLRWLAKTKLDLVAALTAAGVVPTSTSISAEDLTMGELQRVLEHPDNWTKIGIGYDRATFCKAMNEVRETRNAVMHFRDGPDAAAFQRMRDFAAVVQRARP